MNSTLELEINQLHAEVCGGLADPSRIKILYELSTGPKNVTELCNALQMSQPMVSRHLKVLRERRMVSAERHGTIMLYSLNDIRLIQALDLLRAVMRDALLKQAALAEAIKE